MGQGDVRPVTVLALTDAIYNWLSKHGFRMIRCKTPVNGAGRVTVGTILFREDDGGVYKITVERVS